MTFSSLGVVGGGTGRPVLVAFISDFCVVLAGDTFVGSGLEGDGVVSFLFSSRLDFLSFLFGLDFRMAV